MKLALQTLYTSELGLYFPFCFSESLIVNELTCWERVRRGGLPRVVLRVAMIFLCSWDHWAKMSRLHQKCCRNNQTYTGNITSFSWPNDSRVNLLDFNRRCVGISADYNDFRKRIQLILGQSPDTHIKVCDSKTLSWNPALSIFAPVYNHVLTFNQLNCNARERHLIWIANRLRLKVKDNNKRRVFLQICYCH